MRWKPTTRAAITEKARTTTANKAIHASKRARHTDKSAMKSVRPLSASHDTHGMTSVGLNMTTPSDRNQTAMPAAIAAHLLYHRLMLENPRTQSRASFDRKNGHPHFTLSHEAQSYHSFTKTSFRDLLRLVEIQYRYATFRAQTIPYRALWRRSEQRQHKCYA